MSRRLDAAGRTQLLNHLLKQAQAQRRPTPVMVFDLDGTLMDNRPRVVAIFHELAQHWRDKHPDAAQKLAQAHVDMIRYGLVDNLKALGVAAARHEEGLAFWMARFFQDRYMRHDVAIAGAVDYVCRCYDAGVNCVYLTGRDLPNMALGSFASLRDLGFPIGKVGTELVTKPDFDTPDAVFKRDVAGALSRLGKPLAVFDNEPGNCNLLLEAYPDCTSVLVDTLHAHDPPPLHESVLVVDSFET